MLIGDDWYSYYIYEMIQLRFVCIFVHFILFLDMPPLPNVFKFENQSFHVVPELDANKRNFKQIPDDHYLVKSTTEPSRLEEFKNEGKKILMQLLSIYIGLKAISEGKLCVLVLCGGQASRLGGDVPKGSLSLSLGGSFDTLISLQAGQIVKLLRMAKERFPGSQPRIPW